MSSRSRREEEGEVNPTKGPEKLVGRGTEDAKDGGVRKGDKSEQQSVGRRGGEKEERRGKTRRRGDTQAAAAAGGNCSGTWHTATSGTPGQRKRWDGGSLDLGILVWGLCSVLSLFFSPSSRHVFVLYGLLGSQSSQWFPVIACLSRCCRVAAEMKPVPAGVVCDGVFPCPRSFDTLMLFK